MASACNGPDGPPAKRQKMTENVILSDLPANEFVVRLELYSGPKAIVQVEGKEFELPIALLRYNSKFFEKALNGNFKEGIEQLVYLDDYTIEAFELVVQWLYHSKIILPSNTKETICDQSSAAKSKTGNKDDPIKLPGGGTTKIKQDNDLQSMTLSRYLDFLLLADYLQLLGPFDSIEKNILDILINHRCALTPQHVRSAMKLPDGSSVRRLIIRATLKDFINHLRSEIAFKFEKEQSENAEYAAELNRELSKATRGKFLGAGAADRDRCYIVDPLGAVGGRIIVNMLPMVKRSRRDAI